VVSKAPPSFAKAAPPRAQTTTKRDQKRDGRREELSRKIEERRLQREREERNRTLRRWAIFGIPSAAVIILVGILIYNALFGPGVAAYQKGDTIDGVVCNTTEQLTSHYHAHLMIFVNGQEQPIPTDVGRQTPTCLYWLHTHPIQNDDGVIHIESPDTRTFTLKQFFDVWGQDLTKTSLLGKKIDDAHKLTVYVYAPTDQPTDDQQPFTVTPPSDLQAYTDDPTQIVLKPHELIVLEYGGPVVPPSPWQFVAGE
jgi:hypothetical protein